MKHKNALLQEKPALKDKVIIKKTQYPKVGSHSDIVLNAIGIPTNIFSLSSAYFPPSLESVTGTNNQ